METQSALKKVILLLAGSVVMLIAILAIGSTLLISCEPDKAENLAAFDYTKEQLIGRGKYLVNTSAYSDCASPNRMTPSGPAPGTAGLLSAHPSNAPMLQVNKDALKNRGLFGRGVTSADITNDETGIGNWPDDHFLGQP